MGVYTDAMVIHVPFPVTIPKLVLSITYREKVGAYKGPVRILIFLPGDPDDKPSVDQETPFAQLREAATVPPDDPDYPKVDPSFHLSFQINLSPLVLNKRGHIRVRARVGGDIVKLGVLPILDRERAGLPPLA
jgi:hypothetical protein